MVANLGFPISPSMMDIIRRQQEFLELARGPMTALRGIREAHERIEAALAPSRAFAKALDAQMLQIRELSRHNDVMRLQASVSEAVERMRLTQPRFEVKGLFGGALDLSALAEQARLQDMISQQSMTGLLGRVVRELESRDLDEDDSGGLDLADVVEVSAEEMGKVALSEFKRLDVGSWLQLLFQIVFTLILAHGTNQEIAALRGTLSTDVVGLRAGQDSMAAVVAELASAALASGVFDGEVEPTHQLTRSLHLRLGPDVATASVRTYPKGAAVQVLRFSEGWAWVAVWDGSVGSIVIGWMYARYLRALE